MSKFTELFHELLEIDDKYKAPDKLMKILYDREKRENIFRELLDFNWRVDFDWFHEYFQEEHAERKTKMQDFTPSSVSKVISQITDEKRQVDDSETFLEVLKKLCEEEQFEGMTRLDVAAGTGGITITKWNEDRMNHSPFTYKPSYYLYYCEELSDRSIPFLLFNLLIRGMNAVVIHGDSLTRNCKGVFFVQNSKDDHMRFSELNLMPYNKNTEKMFKVKFEDDKGKSTIGYYENIKESKLEDFIKNVKVLA